MSVYPQVCFVVLEEERNMQHQQNSFLCSLFKTQIREKNRMLLKRNRRRKWIQFLPLKLSQTKEGSSCADASLMSFSEKKSQVSFSLENAVKESGRKGCNSLESRQHQSRVINTESTNSLSKEQPEARSKISYNVIPLTRSQGWRWSSWQTEMQIFWSIM